MFRPAILAQAILIIAVVLGSSLAAQGADCTAGTGTAPTLDPVAAGSYRVTGKQATPGKKVHICVDGKDADASSATTDPAPDGTFDLMLRTPLKGGQKVTVQQGAAPAGTDSALSAPVTVGEAEQAAAYSWGRVRGTFSGGAIVSQDQGNLSKTSTYLDLTTDNTWYMKDHCNDWADENASGASRPYKCPVTAKVGVPSFKWGAQINTFFDIRLTALPATACQTSTLTGSSGSGGSGSGKGSGSSGSGGSGSSGTASGTASTTCVAPSDPTTIFVATPKAALVAGGVYLPVYTGWSSWEHDGHRHALYFAPIAKGGFQTLVQSAQSGSSTTVSSTVIGGDTFFHFFNVGSRFGLYKFHDEDRNRVAPDQILYLDVTGGKYQNLPDLKPDGTVKDTPWLLGLEGRFTIPKVPVFLGFNSTTNIRHGSGDLRFLFGTSFDLGCLLAKVGVSNPGIASCDSATKTASAKGSP